VNIYFVLSVCVSEPAFCGSVAVLFIVHTLYLHSCRILLMLILTSIANFFLIRGAHVCN
jgi:hypothetical protein